MAANLAASREEGTDLRVNKLQIHSALTAIKDKIVCLFAHSSSAFVYSADSVTVQWPFLQRMSVSQAPVITQRFTSGFVNITARLKYNCL